VRSARPTRPASAREDLAAARRPTAAPLPPPAPPGPVARIIRKKPAPEVRELRRRVEELERQIHALEQRIAQIGATLTDPKLYLDGDRVRAVSRERKAAEAQMTGLLREWEEVSTALAAHE
jgi:ABC transporter C-terminal domain